MNIHNIQPIFDKDSKILILGSFPSVQSRKSCFFYGNKQNRFWRVISQLCNCNIPTTIEEKKSLLLDNHIAIWDVIHSCDIVGSSDSTICNVTPNDLSVILNECDIRQIYCNGKKSFQLYNQYIQPIINRQAIYLPSTSPANATFRLERLIESWREIIL